MSQKYDDYLTTHISNVNKCHEIVFGEELERRHDASKYSDEEYDAYDEYFYGNDKSDKVYKEFDKAFLHHIHNNPHHWNYWIIADEDYSKTRTVEIPDTYLKEMIADWASFAYAKKDPQNLIDWYIDHRDSIIMEENSRRKLENYIELAYEKLKEYFS